MPFELILEVALSVNSLYLQSDRKIETLQSDRKIETLESFVFQMTIAGGGGYTVLLQEQWLCGLSKSSLDLNCYSVMSALALRNSS